MSDDERRETSEQRDEPAENISGGDGSGGEFAAFDPGEAESRAEAVVDALGELYWQKAYGGQDAFECLVRTVLSQNTSDKASQPAHDSLIARYGHGGTEHRGDLATSLAAAERAELAETISSAGLYNQKSETLIRLADRVVSEYGGDSEGRSPSGSRTQSGDRGFDEFVTDGEPDTVRETLLSWNGVGPKTADCVLLFAGGRGGVFPVDTHVHRIARRMGLAPPDADHEQVRRCLEAAVPAEKCGFGHTATIQFGREYCSARRPACLDGPEACPLYDLCDRVGVDELDGDAVDPSEALAGK